MVKVFWVWEGESENFVVSIREKQDLGLPKPSLEELRAVLGEAGECYKAYKKGNKRKRKLGRYYG